MKQKLLFVSALFLIFITQALKAQSISTKQLVRSSTGVSGSSENITVNNKVYTIQQSIGQVSVIGTFTDTKHILRQGFIQPNAFAKIIDKDIPLKLEAIIYPNPFIESISVSFTEKISNKIEVDVFDMLGRLVFSKSYTANQNLKIAFNNLAVADYILKVKANNKQFIKNIIKK